MSGHPEVRVKERLIGDTQTIHHILLYVVRTMSTKEDG